MKEKQETPAAWPFYCEENVWRASAVPLAAGHEAYALFVSNDAQQVAMWSQRAVPEGRPIVWDYHVVLLECGLEGWEVLDPDCRRGPRLPAPAWLKASWGPLAPGSPEQAPLFRRVPAALFRESFASDRRHMREGDGWQQPPPPWPPIGQGSNLMRFVDMQADFLGDVLDLDALHAFTTRRLPPQTEPKASVS